MMTRMRMIEVSAVALSAALLLSGFGPVVEPNDPGMIPVDVLKRRRAALFERLGNGIAIIRAADLRDFREYPQDSDFRQDNDFYYLTGLETPGSWLVMFSRTGGRDSVALFVPARDPSQEVWTGPKLGAGPEVSKRTGIETIHPSEDFEARLLRPLRESRTLHEFEQLYLPLGERTDDVIGLVRLAAETRRSISDLHEPLAKLRLLKDSVELARLRRAIDITAEAQRAAMRAARPNMFEYELEAVIEYVFRARGAERVGFPSIVGSGPNSVILHYDKNRRRMRSGDLVVVDIGAEYGYYTADVTRTLPVNGSFTRRQREIYELVLATQQVAIEAVRPGATVAELSELARRYMKNHSQGLCGDDTCDKFFIHGLGHWLGMDVHDVGSYTTPLAPGMVLTIEPGIYLADENLGVRIEDDVLVTEHGHEVLSSDAPRTVPEIERLMREEWHLAEVP